MLQFDLIVSSFVFGGFSVLKSLVLALKKRMLFLSKLLQWGKGLASNPLSFLQRLAQRGRRFGQNFDRQALKRRLAYFRWRLLQKLLHTALKTGLLSFLFHHRILGKIHDRINWQPSDDDSLSKNKKKSPFSFLRKLLKKLLEPFRMGIQKVTFEIMCFAWNHYDASLKNPALPHYIGGHGGWTNSDKESLIFLKKTFSVTSMIDIGCGTGGQVDLARKLGIQAFGVDGDDSLKFNKPWFFIHDFTKGHFACNRQFDLAWCVEFLEHVEEKYQPFYMSLFQRAKVVACTAAPPGQDGYHHVNCRDGNYWIKIFKKYGFVFDANNTEKLRKHSRMRCDYMREGGMVFVKK